MTVILFWRLAQETMSQFITTKPEYDITPNNFVTDDAVGSTGFGAADFGEEDFGDARASSTLSFPNDSFSFDNWGEELVFCFAADGKLYRWQPSAPSTIASAISNAPG